MPRSKERIVKHKSAVAVRSRGRKEKKKRGKEEKEKGETRLEFPR